MEAMKRFMVMQSPSFNGEPNVEAAEYWLRRIKRILVGLDIPEKMKVSLTHGSKSRYRSLTWRVPRRIGLDVSVWYRVIRKIT